MLTACGSSAPAPTQPAPDTGVPPPITGRERIGWRQAGDTVTGYTFFLYIDGARQVLGDHACSPADAGSFDCAAPLPGLEAGVHQLEISAGTIVNGVMVEGDRSVPLTVTVAAGANAPASMTSSALHAPLPTPDPDSAPTRPGCGIAPWDASTVVMWDAAGGLRLSDGAASRTMAWRVPSDEGWTLTGVVRDREFETTRNVYLALVSRGDAEDTRFRIARYRAVADVLGERQILVERALPQGATRPWIGQRPDRSLAVALITADAARSRPTPMLILNDAGGWEIDGSIAPARPAAAALGPAGVIVAEQLAADSYRIAWPGRRIISAAQTGRVAALQLDREDAGDRLRVFDISGSMSVWEPHDGGWRQTTRTKVFQGDDDIEAARWLAGVGVFGCRTTPAGLAVLYTPAP